MSTTIIVFLVAIAVFVFWVISVYNRFVTLTQRAKEAWQDIEVQLTRRHDLIPNLVNTVKGYAAHEASTLEAVITARNAAMAAPHTPEGEAQAEAGLATALKSVFALSESYPDLKANTNFQQLMSELADTENKVQAARRFYNGNVRELNTAIEQVPGNIIAGFGNFQAMAYFDIPDEQEAAMAVPPEVKF
jgi:LemA protein